MKPSRLALRHSRPRSLLLTPSPARPTASSLVPGISQSGGIGGGQLDSNARRGSVASRRSFFGVGEILGVLSNPSEVLRSLSESKKLLEEARQELRDSQEKAQIPASHTFSPLPGFFDRPNEIKAITRALGSVPAFTVLFGASSVGKTALLRQVLSSEKYHVLHFDLRIAGFADLSSLYFSLSTQLESYFAAIPDLLGKEFGWGEFEKESWAFKHSRAEIVERLKHGGEVKTSDVARLLEQFQSALLSYWNFVPKTEAQRKRDEQRKKEDDEDESSTVVSAPSTPASALEASHRANDPTEARMRQGAVPTPQLKPKPVEDLIEARSLKEKDDSTRAKQRKDERLEKRKKEDEADEEPQPPAKRVPVFFLDEAHKLPALIQSEETMKAVLDAMLVLTKQDRLCHVLHASSDAFYLHWLRQMNIMQHAQILSIGDTSKAEASRYFKDVLLPHVPEKLLHRLDFEECYAVFGGKLAHLADYVSEFINSEGDIPPYNSSHFLQAHSLLNLQLIHSTPHPSSSSDGDEDSGDTPRGFRIMSPLASASPHSAPSPFSSPSDSGSDFAAEDLLSVMARLQPGPLGEEELPYFPLCRKLGARAVDGMVRGKVLELRWSMTVTPEGDLEEKRRRGESEIREGKKKGPGRVIGGRNVLPVVVPTTPVVRYAMGEVLKEYEEEENEEKGAKAVEKDGKKATEEEAKE